MIKEMIEISCFVSIETHLVIFFETGLQKHFPWEVIMKL